MLNVDNLTEKMNNWFFSLVVNGLLAVGIFLCALLGRSMGIEGPGLAISVVWPATGLSLACLLLFGYKAGFGVFIGNFAYNLAFFHADMPALNLLPISTLVAVSLISLGSFAQANLSCYILKNYSSAQFFRTVEDIFIFLVPASLLSCLIGSIVGVIALLIGGGLERDLILPTWLTFWLGDTLGIYVVTPLLMIWALQPLRSKISKNLPSILCMSLLFALFSGATYYFDYPLYQLFIPISIWSAYLFRMHGASLAIFLMTAISVGFAVYNGYEGTSLISLITFIGVTIAASLIIAAVVNERDEAWELLDARNSYLEKEITMKGEILELVKLDALKSHKVMGHEYKIDVPLSHIELVTKTSQKALREIQKLVEFENLDFSKKQLFANQLRQINQGLSSTLKSIETILKNLR